MSNQPPPQNLPPHDSTGEGRLSPPPTQVAPWASRSQSETLPPASSFQPDQQAGLVNRLQRIYSGRSLENLLLNIGLYLGSFFIISAAALLVNSVATPPLQMLLLGFLTVLVYFVGLLTYQWVPKLRLASYSFTATGLALIPLCGFAIFRLIWPYSGALLWFVISLVGTLAVFGALALMKARVMAYLAIAFLVSDVISISKAVQLGMLWYFVALLVLATALGLILIFSREKIPGPVALGLRDASLVFVPATMLAVFFVGSRLNSWEAALIFTLGTIYAVVFTVLSRSVYLYLQTRIYSLVATIFFTYWFCDWLNDDTYFFLPVTALLFLSALALALIPFRSLTLPWKQSTDAQATWGLGLLFLVIYFFFLSTQNNLTSTLLAQGPSSIQPSLILGSLSILNILTMGVLARSIKADSYVPVSSFLLAGASFILMPPMVVILTLFGLALTCLLLGRGTEIRYRLSYALALTLPGLLLLLLTISRDYKTYPWALLSLSILGAACYLFRELTRPKTASISRLHIASYSLLVLGALGSTVAVLFSFHTWKDPGYGTTRADTFVPFTIGIACLYALVSAGALLTVNRAYRVTPPRPSAADIGPVSDSEALATDAYGLYNLPTVLLSILYPGLILPLLFIPKVLTGSDPYLVCLGLLLGTVTPFIKANAKIRLHIGILVRIYLIWALLHLNFSSDLADDLISTIRVLVLVALSAASALVLRSKVIGSPKLELIMGLIFGWMAFLFAWLLPTSYPLSSQQIVVALALLALSLIWQLFDTRPAISALQSVLLFGVMTLVVFPLLVEPLSSFDRPTSALIIGTLIYAPLKVWASITRPDRVIKSSHEDYLKSWGYRHNRSKAITGLALALWSLLYAAFAGNLPTSLIALGIVTIASCLQTPPRFRLYTLLIGLNLLLLRAFSARNQDGLALYLLHVPILNLSLLAIIFYLRRKGQPLKQSWLFWTAFGFQVFALLPVPEFTPTRLPSQLLVLLVSFVLLGAAATLHRKIPLFLATGVITYQLLRMLGGLNAFTLFFLGFALIGLVVWRLLSRKDEEPQPTLQHQGPTPPQSAQANIQQPAPNPASMGTANGSPQAASHPSTGNYPEQPKQPERKPWDYPLLYPKE